MKQADRHESEGSSSQGRQSRVRVWVQASMMMLIAYAIALDFDVTHRPAAWASLGVFAGVLGFWLATYQPQPLRPIAICCLALLPLFARALDDLQLQHRLNGGTMDWMVVAALVVEAGLLCAWIAGIAKLARSRWLQARLPALRSVGWKACVGLALVLWVGQATLIGPPSYSASPSFWFWLHNASNLENPDLILLAIRWLLCALGMGWALGLHVSGHRLTALALLLGLISAALCARSLMPWIDPDTTGRLLAQTLLPVWLMPFAVFALVLANARLGRWASDTEPA